MDGVEWLVQNAAWFVVTALVLLVGAGLGYYTCSKDLKAEEAKAWELGHQAGMADSARISMNSGRPTRLSDNPFQLREPFSRAPKKSDAPSA